MRRFEDKGWETHLIGMRTLVGMGRDAVGPLVQAMRDVTQGCGCLRLGR